MYSNRPLVNAAAAVTRRRQKPTLEGEKRLPSLSFIQKNLAVALSPPPPAEKEKGKYFRVVALNFAASWLEAVGFLYCAVSQRKIGGLLGILRWGGSVGVGDFENWRKFG